MSAVHFLRRHGMLADQIDEEKELERFLDEMERVRQGGSGSLKMIPSFLGEYHPPKVSSPITVIDIGGTNVRAAVVDMGPDGITGVRFLAPFLTPGIEEEMDAEEFFRRIAAGVSSQDLWKEYAEREGSSLGICFSFALRPSSDRDAEVAFGAKQINVPDLVGSKIGKSFQNALHRLGRPSSQNITVINDAAAAALGGRSLHMVKPYGGYLGFIYGTGTNVSYCTKNGEIINVESGAYCGFPAGDIDHAYDQSLLDTGQDRFEKMVSSGYQKGLTECILSYAVREKKLSFSTWHMLSTMTPGLEPAQISSFMENPPGNGIIARSCDSPHDRQFLLELFDSLTDRSAKLCSITITAGMIAAQAGSDGAMPAFITAEGSAFTKQPGFRKKLEEQMYSLAYKSHGLSFEFHTVPDVILGGTAVACLSGCCSKAIFQNNLKTSSC